MNESFFMCNGTFFQAGMPVITTGNRSFLYGDGLFETMRFQHNILINGALHFERFFKGLQNLKIPFTKEFTADFFEQKIRQLLHKNKIESCARVRLMAFRDERDFSDKSFTHLNYILEAWPIDEVKYINPSGLKMDLFTGAKKGIGPLFNIKTNNYLPFIMARIFARENNLDECILLNAHDRVCESAIANVFIIRQGKVFTPPLSEGCVEGIVRRWLIENLPSEYQIIQQEIFVGDLEEADEIFLTNSIRPVRWVYSFRGKKYVHQITGSIARFVSENMK